MKAIIVFLTLCIICTCCFSQINSEELKLQIVTEDWAPYNYMDNGRLTGFSVEIVNELMSMMGKNYEINLYPGVRSKNKLTNDKNVIMFSLFRTLERESLYKWIGPIDSGSIYFYKRSDDPLTILTIDDAKKVKSISCRYAGLIPDLLRSIGFNNLDTTATDSEQVYKKLLLGRGSLGISDTDLGVIYCLKKMKCPINSLTKIPLKIFEEDLYIACSKDIPDEIVNKWQNTLTELKKSHKFEEIHNKYNH